MQNPFSLSFGKEPLSRIDRTKQKDEIIDSFNAEYSPSQVYMLTGVRGVGKTVLLTEISKYFSEKEEWVVIDLTPERDLLSSLAAELYNHQRLTIIFQQAKINLSFLGIGISIDGADPITDTNIAVRRMLQTLSAQNKKVLITVDEAVCNASMKEFVSLFQIYIRQDLPVYLILSGLYDKIYELQNEKTLTFLYRAPKIELQPLNIGMIAHQYQQIFSLDNGTALSMAKATKGYSFAYQVLGYYTFKNETNWENVLPEYRQTLEEYVYLKLWSELSAKDKNVLISIANADDKQVINIRKSLDMSSNLFNEYRNRLIKKGILVSLGYGQLDFALPYFAEFVQTMI